MSDWDRDGGGSWGGQRSRACFKCNEEGHFSRECPKGGGDTRGCFNCGGHGHISRDCPEPRGGGGRGGGGGGGGGGGYGDEEGEKTSIKVPSSEAGRIIGRQGSTIKDLQYKSGARIKVHQGDGVDREVDIFGSQSERDAAEQLIREIVERGQAAAAAREGDYS
jgi:hypothetical protein